jgi:hypothetical protein
MTTSDSRALSATRHLEGGDAELECFSHGQGVPIMLLPGGGLAVGHLSDLADAPAASGFRPGSHQPGRRRRQDWPDGWSHPA